MIAVKHKELVVLRCKLVVVGDATVGKTALTQVFVNGSAAYPKNYMMTVGAEFSIKQIPIEDTNAVVELYIFDSAGQSIFNQVEMNSKYWENASAVMCVFDISNRESLNSCAKWLTGVKAMMPSPHSSLVGALVGNKDEFRSSADMRAEVHPQEGQQAAAELGLAYFETSAETPRGVDEPFKFIAREFYNRYQSALQEADGLSRSA